MREAVVAILISLFVALWTRLTLRNIAQQPLLRRRNFLDEEIVGSAGLAFVGSSILGWLLLCWRGLVDWHEGGQLMMTALWFGALGLLDDIAIETSVKGWSGHLRAFFKERKITTGFVKLVGGGFGAVLISAWVLLSNPSQTKPMLSLRWLFLWVLGTLLIALSANTLNLLDVRPSRALKGFWVLALVGLIISRFEGWQSILPLLVGTAVYAPLDFNRKAMMGDAGSNPLGACFGVWVLNHWTLPSGGFWSLELWVLLAIFIAVQVYAECRSITEDIRRVPLLRWFDELGVKR